MGRQQTGGAYRTAAANGATHIGLLLLAYDVLIVDMRKAMDACVQNDIAARCKASNHALNLIGHLEGWITYLDDKVLADSLTHFYAMLRQEILHAQRANVAERFQALAVIVGETRVVWQQKETSLQAEQVKRHSKPFVLTSAYGDERASPSGWSA